MSASQPETIRIPDFQSGSEIIGRIPLNDPAAAIHDIDRIFDSLLAAPPEHSVFFQLLELIRSPVTLVAEELTRRYLNKAVPLGDAEDAFFREVARLRLKTASAYAHCFKGSSNAETPQADRHLAALLHRCIHFTGTAILECHRARREVPWGLWFDLHGYHGTAEDMGLATLEIPGIPESRVGSTHCAAAYLVFVLCDMAGGYSLSLRDQKLVYRWAAAWSAMIGLRPVAAGETLPPFVIDPTQDVALRPSPECQRADRLRILDTSRLAAHIERVRQTLRQRIPMSEIGLGEDCTRQQCAQLLGHLARQWSLVRAPRKFRRRATSGSIHVCAGFEEMHYFISGKLFQQPENPRAHSYSGLDDVFALRFQDDPQQVMATVASCHLDVWKMADQSANGFRLMRAVDGRKMTHGQLLALRPHDGEHFLLAQVSWLMQENDGGLIVGLRALPGLPQAICARPLAATGEPRERSYQRAFLLPALATTGAERSLVLPAGCFRPNLEVEIFTDRASRVLLGKMLDSGPDFERVSFEDA
ncbi:MAG: hypothetical protein LBD06_07685 [Candidatus Accumulibacter sp.]|nr:hypothetical protein [Accumulibacter sp.]